MIPLTMIPLSGTHCKTKFHSFELNLFTINEKLIESNLFAIIKSLYIWTCLQWFKNQLNPTCLHKSQVTSYKLQVTSYKLQVTRYKLQVTIQPVCTFDEYRYARVALSPRIRCQHLRVKKSNLKCFPYLLH